MNRKQEDYSEINKINKKEIKKDLHDYHTKHIKQIIANNKNMKILKSNKINGKISIHQHQLKTAQNDIVTEMTETVEHFYKQLFSRFQLVQNQET